MSEIETALIILSKDYDQIFNTINKLITNKGYKTKENGTIRINDTYFDTEDEILKKKQIALRIREINQQISKITLKILQSTTENYSKRIEIEDIYSKEILENYILKINSYLNKHNILKFPLKYYNKDPKLNLINLGFKIIQNKQTIRKIVNAINKNSNQTEFEFVFDTTTYIYNNNNITNIELEIESKLSKNDVLLNDIVKELKLNHTLFKYWPYNKLLTGRVIEILLNNNKLKENKDYDDKKILTLAGLEKIELFIKNSVEWF